MEIARPELNLKLVVRKNRTTKTNPLQIVSL
jgi:hypothetical protein